MRVTIIDYGAGNLRSLTSAFRDLGAVVSVIDQPVALHTVERLVIPGVGAFGWACERMSSTGLKTWVQQLIDRGCPVLGICLGMQWMLESSEEGPGQGLGWIRGRVRRLQNVPRVPHMGWNRVVWTDARPQWLQDVPSGFAYFAHSYYARPDAPDVVWATVTYGNAILPVVIGREPVIGVQFHPEKSDVFGLTFLKTWLEASRWSSFPPLT